MARPRIRLLIPNDPHPMRIERDLAKEIGLNESIVLLQLEYLISISSNERDGRLWTYQTLQDLQQIYFSWWSIATISRIIKDLVKAELIVIGNYNKLGYDRTQWFALNEVGISRLTSVIAHTDAISQNEKCISQDAKSILQFDQMDHVKLQNGFDQNETTIPKSTHKNTQEDSGRAKRAPRTPTEKEEKTPEAVTTALADVCKIDLKLGTKEQKLQLYSTAKDLYSAGLSAGKTPDEIADAIRYVGKHWQANHWKGKKGDTPWPKDIRENWRAAIEARSKNGSAPLTATKPAVAPDAQPAQQSAAKMLELLQQQRGK